MSKLACSIVSQPAGKVTKKLSVHTAGEEE